VPDYIRRCEVCEEFVHRDSVVDGVCADCRELVKRQASTDYEYSDRVGLFVKGLVPSIAPNGQFRTIFSPYGRMSIRFSKEHTKLTRRQRIPKR
jgi:hypothetical protein